ARDLQQPGSHEQPQPTARSVGDAQRLVIGGGAEITDRATGYASYNTSTDSATPANVMDTVKSPTGGPVVGRDIKPTDTIDVGGMRTSISAALAAGLIVQNADGTYRAPGAPASVVSPVTQPEQQEQQNEPQQEQQPEKVVDLE